MLFSFAQLPPVFIIPAALGIALAISLALMGAVYLMYRFRLPQEQRARLNAFALHTSLAFIIIFAGIGALLMLIVR